MKTPANAPGSIEFDPTITKEAAASVESPAVHAARMAQMDSVLADPHQQISVTPGDVEKITALKESLKQNPDVASPEAATEDNDAALPPPLRKEARTTEKEIDDMETQGIMTPRATLVVAPLALSGAAIAVTGLVSTFVSALATGGVGVAVVSGGFILVPAAIGLYSLYKGVKYLRLKNKLKKLQE